MLPTALQEFVLRTYFDAIFDYDFTERTILKCVERFLPGSRPVTPLLKHILLHLWDNEEMFCWYLNEREEAQRKCREYEIILDASLERYPPGLWTETGRLGVCVLGSFFFFFFLNITFRVLLVCSSDTTTASFIQGPIDWKTREQDTVTTSMTKKNC